MDDNQEKSHAGKPDDKDENEEQMVKTPIKILTVGDGDLSLSLALKRAYGDQMEVTATTLCASYEELIDIYDNSSSVVNELKKRNCHVLYNIDATQLQTYPELAKQNFDLTLFHHPHLGLMTSTNSTDEQYHSQRHYVLLAHYFQAAKAIMNASGKAHVCLAHDQPRTWLLEQAANRQGLQLVKSVPTSTPFHDVVEQLNLKQNFMNEHASDDSKKQASSAICTSTSPASCFKLSPLPPQPGYAAPRKYRNGKLGSRHFLGKYGYCHRRTHGIKYDGNACDMNVQGSNHYFFDVTTHKAEENQRPSKHDELDCSICGLTFETRETLQKHKKAPALPDPPKETVLKHKETTPATGMDDTKTKQSPNPINDRSLQHANGSSRSDTSEQGRFERTECHSSWTVSQDENGMRIRRYLQHVTFPGRSQKQCDQLVADGHIQLNHVIIHDNSRILRTGDLVSSLLAETELASKLKAVECASQAKLNVVGSYSFPEHGSNLPKNNYLIVVDKPVGMRTKGDFQSSRTLEQVASFQLNFPYKSLSNLDTGCGGLCAMQKQQQRQQQQQSAVETLNIDMLQIEQTFTILVHGHVPSEWNDGITAAIPWCRVRQWRRRNRNEEIADDTNEEGSGVDFDNYNDGGDGDNISENMDNQQSRDQRGGAGDAKQTAFYSMAIQCIERTSLKRRSLDDKPAPALSTLRVSTCCSASGLSRAICLYLRQQSHPVVGDRLRVREYEGLPRSIRNRIKKKLCLGCFQLKLRWTFSSVEETAKHWTCQVDVPDKVRAQFWQQHWDNATVVTTARRR